MIKVLLVLKTLEEFEYCCSQVIFVYDKVTFVSEIDQSFTIVPFDRITSIKLESL